MDWKDIVRGIAPLVGTALGGPAGGAALAFLSKKLLGKPDGSEAEVAAAIRDMTPQMQLEFKKLDVEFQEHAADIGLDLQKLAVRQDEIAAGDRSSARERQIQLKDRTPQILAYIYTVAFLSVLAMQFYFALSNTKIPDQVLRTLDISTGVLFAFVMASKDYFLGSSKSSQDKDDHIQHMWDTSP